MKLMGILLMMAMASTGLMAARSGSSLVDQATRIDTEAEGTSFLAGLANPASAEARLAMGICYHNLARVKPDAYLKPALQILTKEAKESALAQAYLGSVQTIAGGEALKKGDVGAAAAGTEQGLKVIDAALARDPGNPIIHVLRLNNGLEVAKASPFKRYELLKQDADFLLQQLKSYAPELQAQIWYLCGCLSMATKKLNEALDQFDHAQRAAPKSSFGLLAAKTLASLEE